MTREDIDNIISIICPNDEDFEKPIISPAYLKNELEALALEQEPCDNVCEWFEQYVDIVTDIVELRFSDGTVKRAKRGLYMRDIEKSIRKMLIDQIANEKKQEPCTDAISRQAVLDVLDESRYSNEFCEEHHIDWSINLGMAHIVVNELKPVTPQPCKVSEYDKDHIWYKGSQYISLRRFLEVKAETKQESCTDAISRDKAIVQLSHLLSDWDDDWNVAIRKCIETIKIVPPAAPQYTDAEIQKMQELEQAEIQKAYELGKAEQPKMGRWIEVINGRGGHECDLCYEYAPSYQSGDEYLSQYCPNCGAKMQEVQK